MTVLSTLPAAMEPYVGSQGSKEGASLDSSAAADAPSRQATSPHSLGETGSERSKRDPSPEVLNKRKRVRTAKGAALFKKKEKKGEDDRAAAGPRRSGRVKPSPPAKSANPPRFSYEDVESSPTIAFPPAPAPPQLLVAPPLTIERLPEPATPFPPPPPTSSTVLPPRANQDVEWYFWNTDFQQLYLYPSPLFNPTLEILKFLPGQYLGPLRPSNRLHEDEFIRQQECVPVCGFVARNLLDLVASRMHFARCRRRREYFGESPDPLARLCWLHLFNRYDLS